MVGDGITDGSKIIYQDRNETKEMPLKRSIKIFSQNSIIKQKTAKAHSNIKGRTRETESEIERKNRKESKWI